jgi:hypothetical protein
VAGNIGLAPSVASSGASSPVTAAKPATTLQLSLAEIVEWGLSGTCFRYNEKFMPGHYKECKQLVMIEVLDDDYDFTPHAHRHLVTHHAYDATHRPCGCDGADRSARLWLEAQLHRCRRSAPCGHSPWRSHRPACGGLAEDKH